MRHVAGGALFLVFAIGACVGDDPAPASPSGTDKDGGPTTIGGQPGGDAGTSDGDVGDGSDAGDAGSTAAFTITSSEIDVAAGQETITCYYFHTTNAQDVNVKSWSSTLTAGVKHMAVLFTASDRMPPETVSSSGCGMVASDSNPPSWAYSTWKASDGWSFPADDGAGKPVGKPVKAQQSGYLLMHLVNTSSQPIKVRGTVQAAAYAAGTAVTQAESYVTYNSNISVAPGSSSAQANTCATPSGAKFSWMSTLSHKLSTHTYLKDGASVLFDSTDWANPGSRVDGQSPFAAFASNQVTVECDYTNPTGVTVTSGDAPGNETCMMLAYHFPATKPRLCVNNTLLP